MAADEDEEDRYSTEVIMMTEEGTSSSNKRQKRGPLFTRGDLTNKSPVETAAASACGGEGGETIAIDLKSMPMSMTMNAAEGKPPQPPSKQTDKRMKFIPVKSSGYGRPSTGAGRPSTSTPIVNAHASEIEIERRGGRPGSSPANSVASASRSSLRYSSPQLRHGDGTLHRSGNRTNAAAAASTPQIKTTSSTSTPRGRSASPAPAASVGITLHPRSKRSRTPSPSPAMTRALSKNASTLSAATNDFQQNHLASSPATRQQQQHPSKHRDYSSIDADPTPVKEARRLSSIFQNRSASNTSTHQPSHANNAAAAAAAASTKPPSSTTTQYNLSSPLPRTPSNNSSNKNPTPLSYSKALMKGLVNHNHNNNASLSATKLFPSAENHHSQQLSATTTISQTTILASQLFSLSTGIDTPHLQHLISNTRRVGTNLDLRKQLEQKESDLATLRTALQDLLAGKQQFVEGTIAIEKKLRMELAEVQCNLQSSVTSEATLREKSTEDHTRWMEQIRHCENQCDTHKTKCEVITSELDFTKSEVRRLQDINTEHAVAYALLQSKLEQSNAERDVAIEQAGRADVAKEEAVKDAVAKVVSDGQSLSEMKIECDSLKSELKMQRMIEEEICKLLDIDIASVEFTTLTEDVSDGGSSAKTSILNSIKRRLDEYQEYIVMKEEAEKRLQSCEAELDKVKADYLSAKESIEAKERDMTELMKSISDIQRSGQDREHEMSTRNAMAESQVVECREKILSLGYEKKSLEEALAAVKATCSSHEITIINLQKDISESRLGSTYFESQLQLERDMRSKAEEKSSEERAERIALAAQLNAQLREHVQSEKQLRESMESMRRTMTEQIHQLEQANDNKDCEIKKCNEIIAGLEAHQLSLKKSLSEQKSMLDASKEEEIGRLKGEIANLESRLTSEVRNLQSVGVASEAKVQELEAIIQQGLLERKRMHNIIQELRGNVRVFARIRPFLPDDGEQGNDGETPLVSHDSELKVSVINPSNPSQRHRFSFDRVFAPSAGQEAVFEEVSEFVRSALDGYNVCLFSYGQTGSGKTHTMQGAGTGVMRGLIPRCLEQIGHHKIAEEKDGWEFSMEVSFLEIYNESLKDLLRVNMNQECKHEIKVGTDGRRTVTDLTVKVIDPNDRIAVDGILALAAKRRSTASTDMNATSSRSHSVFTLSMTATHVVRNQVVRGTLNLVDLAGSERLDRSNATGQHAKETVAINKSLSSLVDVFTAIGQKQSHVPFRNSKLTYLLQPALSGDGKTCMIVNLSPTEASVPETLCSLRFASKVNLCELGKAKRTIEEVTNEPQVSASNKSDTAAANHHVKRKV